MNELEKLSQYVVDMKLENVPENVVEAAKICTLDSYSAAIGASKDILIEDIIKEYKSLYPSNEGVNILGHETRLPFIQAAFINSLMGHRLELDDVHTKSKTHIGTVVVPVALALSQHLNSTGKEFLEAVICGYEVMARIGMSFGVSSHRNKGWHVTSTAGTFGAAAVASKLLKLDICQTISAMGMAGTQSFGLWAFLEDSASSKILHPARAASSGIEAAILSKAGMTGPVSILDANDGGLMKAMSDESDLSLVSKNLGIEYEILNVDNKPYPCCRSTHCIIDAAIKIRNEFDINIDNINEIDIETYLVGYKQCGVTAGSIKPVTPTDAKFSSPYTFSAALINGAITLEDFKEENIDNKKIQNLLKKVKVKPSDIFTDCYPEHWGCKATVRMNNLEIYEMEIKDALGSIYNPVSKDEIKNKVIPLLKVSYKENISDLINTIMNIEDSKNLLAI